MTFAPLLGQLQGAAEAEAERRLSHARELAAGLIDAAVRDAERRREAALASRTAHWAGERERRLAVAREHGARAILAATDRLVDRVFRAALALAPAAAREPRAAAWAAGVVGEALTYLPAGTPVVRLSAGLPGPDGRTAADRAPSALGVVVEAADGSVRLDATLERHLRAERPRLAQAIRRRALEAVP